MKTLIFILLLPLCVLAQTIDVRYVNGVKLITAKNENGYFHGQRYIYRNDSLIAIIEFKDGTRDGPFKLRQGEFIVKGTYSGGRLVEKRYYKNNTLVKVEKPKEIKYGEEGDELSEF